MHAGAQHMHLGAGFEEEVSTMRFLEWVGD
jgi:hypothetical protein